MALTRRELLKLATVAPLASAAVGTAPSTARAADRGVRPPAARVPNVVVVVLDDVGFADLGCYGSEVATPAMDSLAARGLRFANFHVPTLCSPTRAALLTGREPHAVGMGTIPEWATERDAYRGEVDPAIELLPERLRAVGYSTYAVGKWHLNQVSAANATGPFDQWPTGRGFDRWYGFHGAIADHWHPELFENTSFVPGPFAPPYHLSVDLMARAEAYLRDHLTAAPAQPFLLYVAFGACHWPLHVPHAEILRYRGVYDRGWDAIREERLARQLASGLVPPNTANAPRNPDVPAWTELPPDERRVAARLQEVYAAFLSHTDAQIGRLLGFLDAHGLREDTAVILLSDNGASREGGRIGAADVRRTHYVGPESTTELLDALDALGDDSTFPAYARGWAQTSNTPLRWYKGTTHGGGIRAPLVVDWPAGLPPGDRGAIRRQFCHVTDLYPTLLDIAGEPSDPAISGRSLAPLLRDGSAEHPKHEQFFETNGQRALWQRGWKAVARHETGTPSSADRWELFRLDDDFAELRDRAADEPEQLASLQRRWTELAIGMGVLPMDDRTTERFDANVSRVRTRFELLPGMARLDRLSAPDIYDRSFRMSADVSLGERVASGVLLAAGTSLAGYEWLVLEGRPVFVYVMTRTERYECRAPYSLDPGRHRLELVFEREARGVGRLVQTVDGTPAGAVRLPRQWPIYSANAGVRCGANPGAPVSRWYAGALPFGRGLERVVVELL